MSFARTLSGFEPIAFYSFMNSLRKSDGEKELDLYTDGQARLDVLRAHLDEALACTDESKILNRILVDLDEIDFVAGKLGQPDDLAQAAKAIVTSLMESDRQHLVLPLLDRLEIESPLLPEQILSAEQADALAHRDISSPSPHRYQTYIKLYERLCLPDMLARQKAAYKKVRDKKVGLLARRIKRKLSSGHILDALPFIATLKHAYALPQEKLDVFGRNITQALTKKDPWMARGFLNSQDRKTLFPNPSAIITDEQIDHIAAYFIANRDYETYTGFCNLFPDKRDAVVARNQAIFDQSKKDLLDETLETAKQAFSQENFGHAWQNATEEIDIHDLPRQPFAALSARVLKKLMRKRKYVSVLHMLQNDPFLDHGAEGLLTAPQIRTLQADLEISDNVAALAGLQGYIARFKKTHTPHANVRLLDTLAPILRDETDAAVLIENLNVIRHADAVQAQNRALAPVWKALASLDPHTPQYTGMLREGKPVNSIFDVLDDEDKKTDKPFSAGSLGALFNAVSHYMNVLQLQKPVIGPIEKAPDVFIDKVLKRENSDFMYATDVFGRARFGKATLAYKPDGRPLQTQYTFLLVKKTDERGHSNTGAICTQRLYSMPLVRIDDDILSLTMDRGSRAMLEAYQDIETIKNHDYFHHLTARIINPYFGDLGMRMDMTDQPYARLMGPSEIREVPDHGSVKVFGDVEYGMESYARKYGNDNEKAELATLGSEPYEFHAMHIQRAVYQNVLHDGPVGRKMESAIDCFFDGLERLCSRLEEKPDPRADADTLKIYYSALAYNALLYVAPYNHPLMQRCEARIDALDINRHALYRLYANREGKRNRETLDEIATAAELDKIPLADMTAAHILRWNAYAIAHKYMGAIHACDEKTRAAQKITLPALRNHLDAVNRDFAKARRRERAQSKAATGTFSL